MTPNPYRLSVSGMFLSGLLVTAGIFHFAAPAAFIAIVPDYLPAPRALVFFSGCAEVALGLLLWVPRWRRLAGWGVMLLLVAVFPANVHMALHPDIFPGVPDWMRWGRLPLQGVLLFWAYAVALRRPAGP